MQAYKILRAAHRNGDDVILARTPLEPIGLLYDFDDHVLAWMTENLTSRWTQPTYASDAPIPYRLSVGFEDEDDVLAFRMRWL
jgi:hypothetical protein